MPTTSSADSSGRRRAWLGVRGRALLCLFLSLPQAACGAGWRQIPAPATGDLPSRQQVQVWWRGRAFQFHGLRVTQDSVSGIPFFQPLECDECRIVVPRTEVDSIRAGNPVNGLWATVGAALLALLVVAFLACRTSGRCAEGST